MVRKKLRKGFGTMSDDMVWVKTSKTIVYHIQVLEIDLHLVIYPLENILPVRWYLVTFLVTIQWENIPPLLQDAEPICGSVKTIWRALNLILILHKPSVTLALGDICKNSRKRCLCIILFLHVPYCYICLDSGHWL